MQQKYLTQYDDLYDDFHIVRFPPLSSCARGCWNTLFYIGRQLLFQFSGAAFTRTTPCNAQVRRPLQKDMSTWSGTFLSHCLDDALMKCAPDAPDTKLLGHLCLRCHVTAMARAGEAAIDGGGDPRGACAFRLCTPHAAAIQPLRTAAGQFQVHIPSQYVRQISRTYRLSPKDG